MMWVLIDMESEGSAYNIDLMALSFKKEEQCNPKIYKSHELPTTPGPLPKKPRHHSSNLNLNPEECKQKSQLCRQFMEMGHCPYQKRCKFAHGTVELQKNQQTNNKYKTKQCDNFNKKWFCLYGNRCNFIHKWGPIKRGKKKRGFSIELGVIKCSTKEESQLLSLLKSDLV